MSHQIDREAFQETVAILVADIQTENERSRCQSARIRPDSLRWNKPKIGERVKADIANHSDSSQDG